MNGKKKKHGYYSNMKCDNLFKYTIDNHFEKSIVDIKNDEPSLYNVLYNKKILNFLVEQDILTNKYKLSKIFSNMDCDNLIKQTIDNFSGDKISHIKEKNYSLFKELKERNLVDYLIEEEVIDKKIQFFAALDCDDLIKYTIDNFSGKTKTELQQMRPSPSSRLRKEGLFDLLLEEKILKPKRRKNNLFKQKDCDDLIKYTIDKHYGISLSNMRNQNATLYKEIHNRKITKILLDEEILVRSILPFDYFNKMGCDDLIKYTIDNFSGKTSTHISNKEHSLYKEIIKRNLTDLLIDEEIILRKIKNNKKNYANKTDNELIKYTTENHFGETITQLVTGNYSLANILKKRELLNILIKKDVIIRKKKRKKKKKVNPNTNYISLDLPQQFSRSNNGIKKKQKEEKIKNDLCQITRNNFDKGNFFEQYVGLVLKYFFPNEQVISQYCLNVGEKNNQGFLGTRVDFKVGNEIYEIKVGNKNSKLNIRESIEKQTKYSCNTFKHNIITLDNYVLEEDLKDKTTQIKFLELIEGNDCLTDFSKKIKNNEIPSEDYLSMTDYAYTMLKKANENNDNSEQIINETLKKLSDNSYKKEKEITKWNPLEASFEWKGNLYTTLIDVSRFMKEESYDENAIRYKNHLKKVANFNKFKQMMKKQVEGIPIGWYDQRHSFIEIKGILYQLNGYKDHKHFVDKCIYKGTLEKNRINLMKYQNKATVEI